MIEATERDLLRAEMHRRFDPPDQLLSPLSLAFLAGLFLLLPAFYPDPDLLRSRIAYIQLALGVVVILAGIWSLGLISLKLLDRRRNHPTHPSPQAKYRWQYYACKYICMGGLTFGIAFSGVMAIHWYFKNPTFTLLYLLLLCFQGGYVLLRFKRELQKLYKTYQQISQGKSPNLSFIGMLAFSITILVDNSTRFLDRPIAILLICLLHVWTAWYFLRLTLLNFGRGAIHIRLGRKITSRG